MTRCFGNSDTHAYKHQWPCDLYGWKAKSVMYPATLSQLQYMPSTEDRYWLLRNTQPKSAVKSTLNLPVIPRAMYPYYNLTPGYTFTNLLQKYKYDSQRCQQQHPCSYTSAGADQTCRGSIGTGLIAAIATIAATAAIARGGAICRAGVRRAFIQGASIHPRRRSNARARSTPRGVCRIRTWTCSD
jgi:hypothetical protein